MKTAKKEFHTSSIASASSFPAQLFRKIKSLTSLPQGVQNYKELAIDCEVFVSYFADKDLMLHQDLPDTVETVQLEVP